MVPVRSARWAGRLLAAYLLAALVVVFQPIPHVAVGSVDVAYRLVVWLQLQRWVTPTMVEFGWNVVLFVPLTCLATLAVRRITWLQWFAVGAGLSVTIELVQLLALSGRSASLVDVVSNSLGAWVGAVLGEGLRRREEHRLATIGYRGRQSFRRDQE